MGAALFFLLGTLAGEPAKPVSQSANLYAPVEWSVTNPSYSGNPFDLPATVTFTHVATGETRTASMFFDGGNTWRYRFTGDLPGEWQYTSTSGDPELNGLSGSVKVAATPPAGSAGNGFIVPQGTQWAGQRGATAQPRPFVPQLAMYPSTPSVFDPQVNPNRIDQDIQTFMVQHGFNGFHVAQIAGRWFDYDADTAVVNSSMQNPDPRTFRALEALIERVHEAGGMVHIWAWGDQENLQTPKNLSGGVNGAVDQRLQRYIAARLGALPGWTMGYGFDLNEWAQIGQIEQWAQRISGDGAWPHLVGARPAGPNTGTNHDAYAPWNENLSYASYEHHKPTYDVYRAALTVESGGEPLDKPVMSEDRFRIRDWDKDYTMVEVRQGLWRSTIAGGVANIWGNLSDGRSNETGSAAFPEPQWVRTYADFFAVEGRFTLDMVAAPQLVGEGAYALLDSKTGRIIVYAESTDRIELTLPAGAHYRVTAVDALNPYAAVKMPDAWSDGSSEFVDLAQVSDWALDLTRVTNPEPGAIGILLAGSWLLGRRR